MPLANAESFARASPRLGQANLRTHVLVPERVVEPRVREGTTSTRLHSARISAAAATGVASRPFPFPSGCPRPVKQRTTPRGCRRIDSSIRSRTAMDTSTAKGS
jgi:hypothetical protein